MARSDGFRGIRDGCYTATRGAEGSIMVDNELCSLDASTLAALIKEREVSPVEVVDAHQIGRAHV